MWLRRPKWATEVEVNIAGATISHHDGWISVEKVWAGSEVVTLKFAASVECVPYPNGEFAVRYGALQYALPIAPERHAIKDYALNDFHDYDIVPQQPAPAAVAPRIDRDGWQIEIDPAFDPVFPWDQSALHLKNGSITLVPIGCTILRQASFGLR